MLSTVIRFGCGDLRDDEIFRLTADMIEPCKSESEPRSSLVIENNMDDKQF